MANGITFSGLGSGLDTQSIISQLTDIEKRPITLNTAKQTGLNGQKEVFRGINTGLLSLKGTVDKLADEKLFSIVKAQSSDADRLGVKATTQAASGTFNVEVMALAQARSLSSRSFSSLSAGLGLSGEFVVNGKSIQVKAVDDLTDIREAINEALRLEMRRDPSIFLMGEEVAGAPGRAHLGFVDAWGGPFRTTQGLIQEFGEARVRDTPISEAGFIGAAVGAAAVGMRPVAELMFSDFVGVCFDQLINNAAKMRYMYGGKVKVPLTLLTRIGAGVGFLLGLVLGRR